MQPLSIQAAEKGTQEKQPLSIEEAEDLIATIEGLVKTSKTSKKNQHLQSHGWSLMYQLHSKGKNGQGKVGGLLVIAPDLTKLYSVVSVKRKLGLHAQAAPLAPSNLELLQHASELDCGSGDSDSDVLCSACGDGSESPGKPYPSL